uniref:Uncharacterized protein n=1 Tax=Rhizophora mucronata TaxID=61149 RepID=A0A2P2NVR9_RHIMU
MKAEGHWLYFSNFDISKEHTFAFFAPFLANLF